MNFIPLFLESNVASSIDRSVPLSERLGIGFQTMFIGLATVFAVLMIIWGLLEIFKIFFYTIPNKRKAAADTPAIETATEEVPAPAGDDSALVAAISAAVSVYLDKPITSFRVVSFKRYDK